MRTNTIQGHLWAQDGELVSAYSKRKTSNCLLFIRNDCTLFRSHIDHRLHFQDADRFGPWGLGFRPTSRSFTYRAGYSAVHTFQISDCGRDEARRSAGRYEARTDDAYKRAMARAETIANR